ncbi:MAG: hypothetical protein ACUVTR_02095 [Dehalococcoidia bacterium]
MAKIIAVESFGDVLGEISKEVKKIIDTPPDNREEMVTFVIYINTLKEMTNSIFEYLPEGEKERIVDICAVWLDFGFLLGNSPWLLSEILKRTRAKIEDT